MFGGAKEDGYDKVLHKAFEYHGKERIPMEGGVQSFVKLLLYRSNVLSGRLNDNQYISLYYIQGLERVRITKIIKTGDDSIIAMEGFDSYGNVSAIVSRIETVNLVMKIEQAQEDIPRQRIGFDTPDFDSC